MNRIYRLVFNRALGLIQVTSELDGICSKTTGDTKRSSRQCRSLRKQTPLTPIAAAIALSLGLSAFILPGMAQAQTYGGNGGAAASTNGGAGGAAGYGGQGGGGSGGAGGAPSETGTGGTGGNITITNSTNGGGGGGSGSTGGTGGTGGTSTTGGAGGDGGAGGASGSVSSSLPAGAVTGTTGVAGNAVTNSYTAGDGGGGGAGGFGAVVTSTLSSAVLNSTVTGGQGGAGGDSAATTIGSGGGGGGGGAGLVIDGAVTGLSISANISGGAGGAGGTSTSPSGDGGGGGGGGAGIVFESGGSGIVISSGVTVSGGAGGAGGNHGGTGTTGNGGQGGAGIIGSGLAITNNGTISGGLGGDGTTRADAIDFTGGSNSLTLSGSSWALNGNINVASGASLTFNQPSAQTLSNVITGAGSIIQNGTGTLTLTGTNTYTGGTTVSAGTLKSGASGAFVSNTAYIVNGGTLDLNSNNLTMSALSGSGGSVALGSAALTVNQTSNTHYSGIISGTGSVTKSGSGTLILSGANTYSGGTTISSGALIGTTTSLQGSITDNATLVFYQSSTGTYSSVISGSGSLIKSGSGTTILNGSSASFTGTTTVSAGTLEIGDASHTSASIGGNVTVNSAGTLRGHGTITGNVTNDGTVYPGGSIGILNVSGNYTQSSSGTLNIEVTPNVSAGAGVGYDQLNVTGTASLAGTLNVQADTGTYTVGSKYDIVHAGTLTGTFATTTLGGGYGSYLTASLSYTGTDAYLTLSPKSGANNSLGPAFTTGQGVAVGDFTTVNSLFSSLNALLNVQGGTAGGILKVNGQPDPGVWVRGLRGFGSAYGAGLSNNAMLAGYGDEVNPGLIIGAAVVNTQSRTQSDVQRVDTHTNGLSGYTLYNKGQLILGASISAGRLDTSSYRTLTSVNKVATGSAGGWYGDLAGKAGWRLTRGQAFLVPSVSASYLHTHRNAYTEGGAGILDLAYSAATYDIGAFSAGLRAGEDLHPISNLTVSPWVGLGAVAYVGDRKQNLPVTLGATQESLATTAAPAKAALVNAGLALMSRGNWSGQLVYHGQFSDHTHMNTADLKVVYRW